MNQDYYYSIFNKNHQLIEQNFLLANSRNSQTHGSSNCIYRNLYNKSKSMDILSSYGVRKRFDRFEVDVPYLLFTNEKIFFVKERFNHIEKFDFTVFLYCHSFNGPINPDEIPKTVKVLIFGNNFNHSIDNLPAQIEIIVFLTESKFNHSVDNLPVGLKGIIFGKNFFKSIELLPSNLEFIDFPLSSCLNSLIFPPYLNTSLDEYR
jgi:hypothetical protein